MPYDSTNWPEPQVVKESQVVKDLRVARKLIERPQHWCQNVFGDGNRLCAFGAISFAVNADGLGSRLGNWPRLSACLEVIQRLAGMNVSVFNDSHGHAEVLALFDRAIAKELAP